MLAYFHRTIRMAVDQTPIRTVLRGLNPSVAHRAADKPNIDEIYAPPHHAVALSADRALVIGGRGVGKSFWAAVLAAAEAREIAAKAYPLLRLDRLDVSLGFHEAAFGSEGVAPSPAALKAALEIAHDPVSIWRSVLMKALVANVGPTKLVDRVKWLETDPESFEDALLKEDAARAKRERPLLLVFDALDVLATDWETIRKLTTALARLALEMSARRAIRLKLFMRRDQFMDMRRSTFADFSKLRTAAVELEWRPVDLYGALFTRLWGDPNAHRVLRKLGRTIPLSMPEGDLPSDLKDDPKKQEVLFAALAGEFMGTNRKRGRTYTWVPKHLADAHGETSLRSFLIALREAAERANRPGLAIDSHGLNAGVLKASGTRREELKEDHPWVEDALEALSGLTVPCDEEEMLSRWRDGNVLPRIRRRRDPQRPAAPLQLEVPDYGTPEQGLLSALIDLGVVERRAGMRVNVPDIFRVAARMKRKGGVALPRRS
ncbi:MAG TPA: hypothetical protein VFZ16_09315 [Hyphomicrobiaceae bacterium]|nr:hypothetical protein [Hyphomicrobiaceae bacterium]